jgi:isocitrate/isopropylmalate dehydrogenase
MTTIRDPFKKTTNWAKKAEERLTSEKIEKKTVPKNKARENKPIERVAKSFKIYPGKISRNFDKRVNKLQVHYDDLDYDKNYVDAGKYMMFLMSFAEKYNLHELYSEVDKEGKFELDSKKVKELFI